MTITYQDISIPAASLGGENPLPVFRSEKTDLDIPYDASFTPEEAELLGYSQGNRILPYLKQDRYDRNRVRRPIKAVILENECLRATVLPDYGGRLWSLYDKVEDRELLFRNPVIQPANLAIRDAWLSGGVEWNVSQLGHTFTTCSPMFCAEVAIPMGETFFRIYEFERQKKLFWQVDFHLPENSRELFCYVRIVNDNSHETPMYWWSTTAVPEDSSTRVLMNGKRAMYTDPRTGVNGMTDLPYVSCFGPKDYSYPLNMKVSNDFFVQIPDSVKTPWEAAAYGNGNVTFEKSTSLLHYRKIFCWGDRPGGWRWKEYLSEEGGGSYIEIQAGIGRSQRHGLKMPANTSWDFTTAFGGLSGDVKQLHDPDWEAACHYLDGCLHDRVTPARLYGSHRHYADLAKVAPTKILHFGSGFGALESMIRRANGKKIPDGFAFPEEALDAPARYWLTLLTDGALPDGDPVSYSTDPALRAALERSPDSWQKFYHLGVMAAEDPDRKTAAELFARSNSLKKNVWALRALACLTSDPEKSAALYGEAFALGFPDVAFAQEYLSILLAKRDYDTLLGCYRQLPEDYQQDERVLLSAVSASLAKDDISLCDESGFFERDFANIREGEISLSELWFTYTSIKLAAEKKTERTPAFEEWVRKNSNLPRNLDFRMR